MNNRPISSHIAALIFYFYFYYFKVIQFSLLTCSIISGLPELSLAFPEYLSLWDNLRLLFLFYSKVMTWF